MAKYQYVSVEKIDLWNDNPRVMGGGKKEDEIIHNLFDGESNVNNQKDLAKDILLNRLMPNDLPILVEKKDISGEYYCFEGNRRLAILKILNNPDILSFAPKLVSFFENLRELNASAVTELNNVYCCITSEDEAKKIVEKLHTSPQGVSRKPWGSEEKEYFYDFIFPDAGKKKSHAFHINNTYKDRFSNYIEKINSYTSINRILDFSIIKDLLGLTTYETLSDDQIEIINYYFERSLVVSSDKSINLSRFTLSFVRGNILDDLRKKRDEILTRKERFKFKYTELIEIDKGSNLQIPVEIIEKTTSAVVPSTEIIISYHDSRGRSIPTIDTNICGTYQFSISCHGEEKKGSIIIKLPVKPDFFLKKSTIQIETEETLALRDYIDTSDPRILYDNISISNKMESGAILDKDIFSKDNLPGEYKILYTYTYPDGSQGTRTLVIQVKKPDPISPLPAAIYPVFSNPNVTRYGVNWATSVIISQTLDTDFDKSYSLIAAGYRAIVELSLITLLGNHHLTIGSSLKEKLAEYFKYICANINMISPICKRESLSFETFKNFAISYDSTKIDTLVSNLHMNTHSTGTMSNKPAILNWGQTEITSLIILFYLTK